MLLVASNVFYGAWDVRFLGLLWFSALIDFFVAQRIEDASDRRVKRRWLTFSITTQLLLLGTFKYLNFGIESAVALLEAFGFEAHLPHAEHHPARGHFVLYVPDHRLHDRRVPRQGQTLPGSARFFVVRRFFPAARCGTRSRLQATCSRKLVRKRVIDQASIRIGIYWILIGFFKKVVIADTLAPLVQHTFDNHDSISGVSSLIGVVAFSLQIYGDFAGYTFIARGIAKLMGIDLAVNFRRPYLATSPRDFLAPVAHQPLELAARLSLHQPGRQPARSVQNLRQPPAHDALGRALARRRVEFRRLGHLPRHAALHRSFFGPTRRAPASPTNYL
jgi:D-alanyl-lipoteichoic acid acyltransferase DltB (MBOAT superfamily)